MTSQNYIVCFPTPIEALPSLGYALAQMVDRVRQGISSGNGRVAVRHGRNAVKR